MLWGEGDPWMNCRQKGEQFRKYLPFPHRGNICRRGTAPTMKLPDQVNCLMRDWVLGLAEAKA